MYNSVTEEKIKQIPQIIGIDISRLPQELTRIYSEIVSIRKQLSERNSEEIKDLENKIAILRKLANNLETFVVGLPEHDKKESAAFVAGTAHNLLWNINKNILNRNEIISIENILHKDFISSEISAIILFIIGNSLADAAELANKIIYEEKKYGVRSVLFNFIKNLAIGKLSIIINTEVPSVNIIDVDNEEMAISILWSKLCYGIQQLAKNLLEQNTEQGINYFQEVISLANIEYENIAIPFQSQSIFSGPYHLAKLLKLLENDLLSRGIIKIPPPENVEESKWYGFTKELAKVRPYLWENHFTAINSSAFLNPNNSAILTFPTGAGKSTLAELKIASSLFNNRSVIYIVPTHALEDQVNDNLRKLFPDVNISQNLDIDSEYTEIGLEKLAEINVMTPERCLALLGVKPELFGEIGLIVFDEFHLIHGKQDSADRRNLDAMYCLLLLLNKISEADYLLISAMVENGKEISEWLSQVTGRPCFSFNSSWKPTRQMQGCIIYDKKKVDALKILIDSEKQKNQTKAPSAKLKKSLLIEPICLFSLINMWESKSTNDYHVINNFVDKVNLSAASKEKEDPEEIVENSIWYLTPNKFEVASSLVSKFILMGLKVLVFVDTPKNTIGTAKKISQKISSTIGNRKNLYEKYSDYLSNLALELGKQEFAFLSKDGLVGVHHGNMLPKERILCENLFKQKDGLQVIVATPTIAQGINIPAEVVIIAGDDRYDYKTQIKEKLEPYEILNTAGRAGRAGMSSQGVVIVIPGNITTLEKEDSKFVLTKNWWQLKENIFSKSDQCLTINDPIEYFLDSLQSESDTFTEVYKATLYRLNENEDSNREFLSKSLYYYRLKKNNKLDFFEQKIQTVQKRRKEILKEIIYPTWVLNVSIAMGLEPEIVSEVGDEIERIGFDNIFARTLIELIEIPFDWMNLDINRIKKLFSKTSSLENLLKILEIDKKKFEQNNSIPSFLKIKDLLISWVTGDTYEKINDYIEIKRKVASENYCDKARLFILKIIPEISFIFGLFSMIIKEKTIEKGSNPKNIPLTISTLSSCIREGLDSENKLAFKFKNRHLSRIEIHRKFEEMNLNEINVSTFEELVDSF